VRFENFGAVRPEWIDHNGHMNVAWYIAALDPATDLLWDELGLGDPLEPEQTPDPDDENKADDQPDGPDDEQPDASDEGGDASSDQGQDHAPDSEQSESSDVAQTDADMLSDPEASADGMEGVVPWRPNAPDLDGWKDSDYKPFTSDFDEVVEAADLCEPEELERLRAIVAEEMKAQVARDKRRRVQLSGDFHRALADLADNAVLAGFVSFLPVDFSGNEGDLSPEICVSDACPLFQLPNVFTPNGDGVNDVFQPLNYAPFGLRGVALVECFIYDRAGRLLSTSRQVDRLWDGKVDGRTNELECCGPHRPEAIAVQCQGDKRNEQSAINDKQRGLDADILLRCHELRRRRCRDESESGKSFVQSTPTKGHAATAYYGEQTD